MSRGILIVGESGSGKSASIEGLNPDETFIISTKDKPLPFRKGVNYSVERKNYFVTDQSNLIVSMLKNISAKAPNIKTIVLDDVQYVAADEFMLKVSEAGWDKFNMMAKNVYDIIDISGKLRDDLKIFYLWHSETIVDNGVTKLKAKTIGKILDQYITVEGLFTFVLFTFVGKTKNGVKHVFLTNTDGTNTAKTPKEMFEPEIPNDLQIVSEGINKYYTKRPELNHSVKIEKKVEVI